MNQKKATAMSKIKIQEKQLNNLEFHIFELFNINNLSKPKQFEFIVLKVFDQVMVRQQFNSIIQQNFLQKFYNKAKMRVQNSFLSSTPTSKSIKEVREIMQNIKSPFLNKIQHAKSHFNQQIENFRLTTPEELSFSKIPQNHQKHSSQSIASGLNLEQIKVDQPRILTQSSCEEVLQQIKEPYYREWTKGSKEHGFSEMNKLLQHYQKVFEKKTKFSKSHCLLGESFKIQQKRIIEQIFYQIGNLEEKTVEFTKIIQFFEKCTLFHLVYNIHPNSLLMTLKDSAHYFPDRLTEEEFMDLFLLNTRTNIEYQNFNIERIHNKCMLSQQNWKDLKEIFIIYDTFGNETIQLKQFFQKIRTSVRHKYLLQLEVIFYPSIKRSYQLKRILFELQTKRKIGQSFVKWQQIKQYIINFAPVKEPTIDIIYKQAIISGKITNNNNNFMLKDQILSFLKTVFFRCPKYCDNFVKISHYCQEIRESDQTKEYLNQIVRNVPVVNTFREVLKQLSNEKLKYLDLDQILQRFSLKAIVNQTQKVKSFNQIWDRQQNSDDEQQFNKRKIVQKQNKIQVNNKKKVNYKYEPKKQNTLIQEFSLTKKTKSSIRDRKVQQMIQQIKQKQREQSRKKFKANPIPSSINNEKYNQYKLQMAKNKELILKKLNQASTKDALILKYLEANTKLFEPPKDFTVNKPVNQYQFQPKPIPWYVHTNLLQKIEQQKQQKRKLLKKQTKYKYFRQWKNLPTFINGQNFQTTSRQYITKESTEKGILSQLQKGKIKIQDNSPKIQKSKVKEVPNFQLLHEQFIQSLEKRKKTFTPTKIQEFKLTSPKQKQVSQQKVVLKHSYSHTTRKPEISTNFIGSTLKYQSLVKLNKQKKILKEKQKQQQTQKEIKRIKSQQLFAKLMRKQLKKQQKLSSFSNRSKKSRVTSQDNINNKKQLAKMYKRVFERPFLFQSSSNLNNRESSFRPEPVKIRDNQYHINQLIEQIQPHQLGYYSKGGIPEQAFEPQSNQSI